MTNDVTHEPRVSLDTGCVSNMYVGPRGDLVYWVVGPLGSWLEY